MPNSPATPNRSVRVPDELWAQVQRIADDQGVTATEVVIKALTSYVRGYPG